MKKSRIQSARDSTTQLQRAARERADDQARRIPWQRLLQARNQYIDWQEFNLWVRSILEVEKAASRIGWSRSSTTVVQDFLKPRKELTPKAAKNRPLPLRLEDWIDDHIFGFARQEGWFSAITFYAIREPRYQRAEVCWSECVERWKKAKPLQYPSFEEWKDMAAQCDDTAHLLPEVSARQGRLRSSLLRSLGRGCFPLHRLGGVRVLGAASDGTQSGSYPPRLRVRLNEPLPWIFGSSRPRNRGVWAASNPGSN